MTADKQIRVSEETRDELAGIGSKGETYDEIIQDLLEIRSRAGSMGLLGGDE